MEELGIHWTRSFLSRHPDLKKKFVVGLDKERSLAQNPEIITNWFQLFYDVVKEYNIDSNDIYNMDEKGILIGVIKKVKVLISKHEKKNYMIHDGSYEQVTLIECISLSGKVINPQIIFKGKQQQKAWFTALKEGHIALSNNGWTDNELGLEWLKQSFELQTRKLYRKSEYRLLILDGHASHITTEAIKFYIASKVVLLYLPLYTTHILQPLDYGPFATLAIKYSRGILDRFQFATYNINKMDFLEIYQAARLESFTMEGIRKAWTSVGLSPFNPDLVLQALLGYNDSRLITPPSISMTIGSMQVPITPANVLEVQELIKSIADQGLDCIVLERLAKLEKGACKAIATAQLQSTANDKLIKAIKEKKKREKGPTNQQHYGYARVMDLEAVQERIHQANIRFMNTTWKELLRLGPAIFTWPTPLKKRVVGWKKAIEPEPGLEPELEMEVEPIITRAGRVSPRKRRQEP